jgi:hypothetical protein
MHHAPRRDHIGRWGLACIMQCSDRRGARNVAFA